LIIQLKLNGSILIPLACRGRAAIWGVDLSGTGPKAGGPHYLLRMMAERTITVNTAAIGGDLALYAS